MAMCDSTATQEEQMTQEGSNKEVAKTRKEQEELELQWESDKEVPWSLHQEHQKQAPATHTVAKAAAESIAKLGNKTLVIRIQLNSKDDEGKKASQHGGHAGKKDDSKTTPEKEPHAMEEQHKQ